MADISVKEYGKKNDKVILLIGGWKYRSYMLHFPALILAKHGYYCITYTYDNDVFSPNVSKTAVELTCIKNILVQKVHQLHQNGYKTIHLFGTSLGSAIAILVANESLSISHIILNTAGADIAESVWHGKLYQRFKKELTQRHIDFDEMAKLTKDVSPQNNAQNIKNKKILILLAKKDMIIPYEQGNKFYHQLRLHNTVTKITNNHLSHSLTGLVNLFSAKKYLTFLES